MKEENKAIDRGDKKYKISKRSEKLTGNAISKANGQTLGKKRVKVTRQLMKEIDNANTDENIGIKSATGVYASASKVKDFAKMAQNLKKKKPTDLRKNAYSTRQSDGFAKVEEKAEDNQFSLIKKKRNNTKKHGVQKNNNSFVSKANGNQAGSASQSIVNNKSINKSISRPLGSAVSKTFDMSVKQIDKSNIDQNVGIKGTTSSITGGRKVYQTGRQTFAQAKNFFARRKIQQQAIKTGSKKVISSATRAATTKALTASLGTTIAPVIIIILIAFLLFFMIVAVIVPTSYHQLSSYPGSDEDVSESNQQLTGKAQELKASVIEAEGNPAYSHIDEFRYSPSLATIIDSFDYDPFVLLAYLSAKYQEYNMNDVKPEIDSIMMEMFDLRFTEITETRYDSDDDPYDYYVLVITFVKKDLETIVLERMTEEEKKLYRLYLEETADVKGNIYNPFDLDWYGYISCKMGWRYIDGKEDNHTGMDISWGGIAGTPMRAGVTGTVTKVTYASDGGSYGNRVEISTPNKEVTVLYAHMTDIHVSLGDPVMAGITTVGTVGTTGWSTGPHLHIEVFKSGQRIDPILVLSRETNV